MRTLLRIREEASALIIALLAVFVISALIGIASQLTSATARQTDSSGDFSALRSAAEGALDYGYGVWARTINNYYKPVSKTQLGTITTPSFTGLTVASALQIDAVNEYGQPLASSSATPTSTKINLDNYPGWAGFNSAYVASVRLTGASTGGRLVNYGVKRAMNYSVVPLFQATAFFEDNLELYKTAPMTITGLVHTNSHAYVSQPSPGTLTFGDATTPTYLSYVGGYTDSTWVDSGGITRDAPPEAWNWSGYTPNSSQRPDYFAGYDQQVHQVARMEPLGADASSLLDATDVNRNNDSARELIEPPNTYVDPLTQQITSTPALPDPTPIADRRLYNKAGIRIRVNGATYAITGANGATLSAAQITALKSSLTQQTIYDRREGKNVDLTTLDLSTAKSTLNAVSGFNGILYIDDASATGYTDPKGIRLVNGSTLPTDGLTVASQNPVYIQGDYNTSGTRVSSAVFADGVTILSNNWSDSNSNGTLSSRQASNTTVNTAIVGGFLPSGWTNPVTGAQYGYSGGLNNFPRFLEDWKNKTFTYVGSMIELFTSQIATGEWDTGSIYVPPIRVWSFDSNFVDNPPPGSLTAVTLARGSLIRF
jgi:hypothetical protein